MLDQADRLAHEFNNLLTTILGYANLLARSLDDGDPRRADAEEIVASAQRASDLIRDLKNLGLPAATGGQVGTASQPVGHSTSDVQPGRPGVILVVDDERAVRYLVRTILTRAGHDVAEAAGAAEACRWVDRHAGPLDLVISDLALADGTGPDLVVRLRGARPGLKVLLMSGSSDDEIRRDSRIPPDTPFIQKPFSPGGLTDKLREILE